MEHGLEILPILAADCTALGTMMALIRGSTTSYQKDLARIDQNKAKLEREKDAVTARYDKLQNEVVSLQQEKDGIRSSLCWQRSRLRYRRRRSVSYCALDSLG
jgi:predicted  nucleic acid-binding Zn-ribbon protein